MFFQGDCEAPREKFFYKFCGLFILLHLSLGFWVFIKKVWGFCKKNLGFLKKFGVFEKKFGVFEKKLWVCKNIQDFRGKDRMCMEPLSFSKILLSKHEYDIKKDILLLTTSMFGIHLLASCNELVASIFVMAKVGCRGFFVLHHISTV